MLDIDSSKAFNMVAALEASGIVVKRHHSGGRKYTALERSFPAYIELCAFLRAVAANYFLPTKENPRGLPLDLDDFLVAHAQHDDRFAARLAGSRSMPRFRRAPAA